MNLQEFDLLIHALSTPRAAFVLGAGASSPAVPTFNQLAGKIASYTPLLNSFPAAPIPRSGLRDLMQPVLDQARMTTELEEWKAGSMTTASIAVILENIISRAHGVRLPQYAVFGLFSRDASIVSFNWDGLAAARCAQRVIIHPHGIVVPRPYSTSDVENWLFDAQMIDDPTIRDVYLPGLVLPGEEESAAMTMMREKVLHLWLTSPIAIVVGYSFGLASGIQYDRVWLDTFVEAFSRNPDAPIHIISPDAVAIVEQLRDRMHRRINMFSWPLCWDVLAEMLLEILPDGSNVPLASMRVGSDSAERALIALNRAMAVNS
jgi:hypothetical protein